MNEALESLIGHRVQVWSVGGSGQGFTDTGILDGFDDPWLRLRTNDGEVLCFPVHNVRLVKLLDRGAGDAHVTIA